VYLNRQPPMLKKLKEASEAAARIKEREAAEKQALENPASVEAQPAAEKQALENPPPKKNLKTESTTREGSVKVGNSCSC